MNESVEMFDAKEGQDATISSVTVEPTVGEGFSVDTVESKACGDRVVNTGDATVNTVDTVVDAVVDTVTADVNDSADLGTTNENPRLPPVISSEPTVLLCPTVCANVDLKSFILQQNVCVQRCDKIHFPWKFQNKEFLALHLPEFTRFFQLLAHD